MSGKVEAGRSNRLSVSPPEVTAPWTREEIRRELRSVHDQGSRFWAQFEIEEFFAPLGTGWSPADTVRHLIKSNAPVAGALGYPKLVLRMLFGGAKRPSRPYDELVAVYRAALSNGLEAGRFSPRPRPQDEGVDPGVLRARLFAKRETIERDLESTLDRWSEPQLDRLRLPHPGIGRLTVREMLFFTVYHNEHHALGTERRWETPADLS